MNSQPPSSIPQPVTVTDINIPFGRLVGLILKIMLASIPAVLIMYAIMAAIGLLFVGLLGGLGALSQGFKLQH
jgi:hypothetical protein